MRNKVILVFLISSVLSLLLFNMSGFDINLLFNPLSKITDFISGQSLDMNFFFIVLALIVFPLSLASIAFYGLITKNSDYSVLIGPLLLSMIILLLNKFSFLSVVFSMSLILAGFIILKSSFFDTEIYKKISPYKIGSTAVSKGVLLMNILIIISVFVSMSGNTQEQQIKDEFVDMIITNLASQSGENADQIQEQLQENRSEVEAMIETNPLITTLINVYPYLVVIGIFAVIEFLKSMILAPLSGIYCSIMWRMTAQ